MEKMRATVFHGVNDIRVEEVARPRAGVGEAVMRVTLTTICGTDLHLVRDEYPVEPGRIIGHEPVSVILARNQIWVNLRNASGGRNGS